MNALTTFDDALLAEDVRTTIRATAERIRVRLKRTAEDIIEIGNDLLIVKAQLEHGQFTDWLSAEFEFSEQTARRFMQVAERFGKTNNLLDFKPAILYALSAPSTPDAVREAAIELAHAGQTVTLADVEALKREAQQERETRQLLAKKLEQAQRQNQTLDLNLQAASEREQRTYKELLATQDQIATLAQEQSSAAIEQTRLEMQAAQQRLDDLRQQLERLEREKKNAIREGIKSGMAQRQEELNQLERDIQYAEASLKDYRQPLQERTGDEHENQRLNIDAEKALRELMVLGTTLNMFEAKVLYTVNQELLERITLCANAVVPLIEAFQHNHRQQEKPVSAIPAAQ